MLITKKVLQDLNACKEGLNWWVNNGLTSFDSKNLRHIKGEYNEYIDWLKDEFDDLPVRTYDEYGNMLTFKTSSNGISKEFTYDQYGNKLTANCNNGYSEEFTYDKCGNNIIYKNSFTSITYTYDKHGNKLTSKDSEGNTKKFTYDRYGNMLTSKDGGNPIIRYEHIHTKYRYIIKEGGEIILTIPKVIESQEHITRFKCAMCDQFHNNGVKVIYNGADVLVCKDCFKEYWVGN